jgi:hypothetical protein
VTGDLATDKRKPALFDRLAMRLATLADQVEHVMLTPGRSEVRFVPRLIRYLPP